MPTSHKPNLDRTFLRQLRAVLRIALPGWRTPEAALLSAHSFFLVFRTVLSIAVARLDGRIVRDLVNADGKGFLKGLGLWFALAVPSTYTNTMVRIAHFDSLVCVLNVLSWQIHYLQATLALRLRSRLARYTHDLYLSSAPDMRYYRIALEGGLEDVDQYITSDIAAFCESLAGI